VNGYLGVHSVSQWPNLRHLGESLGGAESLVIFQIVNFTEINE